MYCSISITDDPDWMTRGTNKQATVTDCIIWVLRITVTRSQYTPSRCSLFNVTAAKKRLLKGQMKEL